MVLILLFMFNSVKQSLTVWLTVPLAMIGYFIYRFTYIKTTNDVYVLATEYSHEIGYVILAVAVFVVGFLIYKGIKQKK